ncbi:MAG: CaiB/BaiF CoA-transferase family protein [Actinomycetota bacterium]|jgi:formyl-CoA transferase|nr:CaiB/BaiF CoA-transferase family protein [Actinomycetota bacterium]|tara:strand:+ start:1135 stop:2325 length:1191 start_codon:yes stop_codon:yes gene_type:complete
MTALRELRVLDVTQYEAGPSCTQALAWFGADVVKVEPPGRGDPGRGGDIIPQNYFLQWNSNKRSIAIDLTHEEGRQLLLEMAAHYDVFVENYGPGVVDRLNLGYEVLREVNPSIIYASVKGFGSTGPYADRKCFDGVAQAMAGALSITGRPDDEPLLPGTTTGDSGTGVQLGMAILAAYIQRLQTGDGQYVEIAMQEAMTYYMRTRMAMASGWNDEPVARIGNGSRAVNNLYPCKGDGANDYVMIMAITPKMWINLCSAMGKPELSDDPRFARNRDRVDNNDALRNEISAWTKGLTKEEVTELLAAEDVPGGPVLDTSELLNDRHLKERGFITTIEHPDRGEVPILGWAPRLSASSVDLVAAPALGEHTAEVLTQDLQLPAATIQRLIDESIIGGS